MKVEDKKQAKYSVIVLFERSDDDLLRLIQMFNAVFCSRRQPFEIIFVANGEGDILRRKLEKFHGYTSEIKVLELNKKTPQAVRLKAGFEESHGEIIVVCNSHEQISNNSMLRLLDSLDNETDIINPWRQQRDDSGFNQFHSRIYNSLIHKVTRSDLHDLSCPIKIFRREVLKETEIYGNMYSFLPILAEQKGFRTKEVKCESFEQNDPQKRNKMRFYHLSEYVVRIIDIFTLYFITHFTKKPLRFFSSLGIGFLFIGLLINGYVFVEKFLMGYSIGGRPILLIGIFLIVLGIQTASMGLLGEMIAFTHGRQKPQYTIEKQI